MAGCCACTIHECFNTSVCVYILGTHYQENQCMTLVYSIRLLINLRPHSVLSHFWLSTKMKTYEHRHKHTNQYIVYTESTIILTIRIKHMHWLVCKHGCVIVYLSKHAYMHCVLVSVNVTHLWVCERKQVCLRAGVSDKDITVSRLRARLEYWGGLGGSTGRKDDAVCLEIHTTIRTHLLTHTPSLPLSWPLLLLYVWHAACFKGRTTRHNTVCLGNSLLLHHSLLRCTFLSALLLRSLTLFPNFDSTETLKQLLLAQPSHRSDSLPPSPIAPSFPLVTSKQKIHQPRSQKWSIFNFSTLFHVVSGRDVSKQEPWGGKRKEEKGEGW